MLPPVPQAWLPISTCLSNPCKNSSTYSTCVGSSSFTAPLGTGKTYVAKKLAERLAGSQDPSRVRLVQFHPSYAYEDFFEGFRPVEKDGQAHFSLQDGPLKLMAEEARKAENRDKAVRPHHR